MRFQLSRFSSALIDLVLPPRCVACNTLVARTQQAFCVICHQSLLENEDPCPRCALPDSGDDCASCRRQRLPFRSARSPLIYGGQLAEALYRLKYRDATEVSARLARFVTPDFIALAPEVDIALAVPLHRRRLRKRGYNQSALLMRHVPGLPKVFGALRRVRATKAQADLPRQRRLENLRGAFVADEGRVSGRRVLLFDDVMTTGATVIAASQALRTAGALSVDVLTLARAVP